MNCCGPAQSSQRSGGTNRLFSRFARGYAKSYRKRGLDAEQQLLADGVRAALDPGDAAGNRELQLLDIGCGVGALHLELLNTQTKASAHGIDIADGMLQEARSIANEHGLADRTSYTHGDFVELANQIAPADVTLLDKVVCCYENVADLVRLSTDRTRAVYAVSRPRDVWYMRFAFKTQATLMRWLRFAFYPCWHSWSDVHDQILAAGFESASQTQTRLWHVEIYRRRAV